MILSSDQQKIIDLVCSPPRSDDADQIKRHLISVPAVAGSGKSLVIIHLARLLSDKKILFLSHGRNIAERAKSTLPHNVRSSTVAAMALSFLRKTHSAKVNNKKIPSRLSNEAMFSAAPTGATHDDIIRARRILSRFYVSSNRFPEPSNVPPPLGPQDTWLENPREVNAALDVARTIWFSQINRKQNSVPLTYPAALKLWTQSNSENHHNDETGKSHRISPLGECDIIIIEESQDSSEALLDFLVRQDKYATLLVGDPFQALTPGDWRIQKLEHPIHRQAIKVNMQHSWRFGPSIASALNALTAKAGEPTERIVGLGRSNVYPASKRHQWTSQQQHYTFIANYWSTLFGAALEASLHGKTIAWVDGLESYPITLLRDLVALDTPHDPARHKLPPQRQIVTPWIQQCRDLDAAKEKSAKYYNKNYVGLCDWIKFHRGTDLFYHIDKWREDDAVRQKTMLAKGTPPHRDITFSTIERAKGNEFLRVVIADDLVPMHLLKDWRADKESRRDINALYTAISRAQCEVAIPDELLKHFSQHEWTLLPNSFNNGDVVPEEKKIDPHFGASPEATLEMIPNNRKDRKPEKDHTPRSLASSNQHTIVRQQFEEGVKEYSQYSTDELKSKLFGRRLRRKR